MGDGTLLWLTVAGVVVAFPVIAWLFGWSVLGWLSFLDREERFVAAGGVGFAFLAGFRFLGFALQADASSWAHWTVLVMIVIAIATRARHVSRHSTDSDSPPWTLAGLLALAYLELVCVQGAFPDYRGSRWYFDWWMHYDEALVFLGGRDIDVKWAGAYTLASRTPLFNLTTAAVMALAGHDFAVYQLASALTNCAVVGALALLARDFFGRPGARLALLLAPLNLWLLHNAWFTWPKMLAAYYLLLGLHFYVRSVRLRRSDPRAAAGLFLGFWACSLLGFLTHQVVVVYAAPLLLHAAWLAVRDRAYRPGWKEVAATVTIAALAAGPWYGWLLVHFGTATVTGSTPVTHGDESAVFAPLQIADWMIHNTRASVWPLTLVGALRHTPRDGVMVYQGLTELYVSLLTGALTLSLTAFLIVVFVWRLCRRLAGAVRRLAPSTLPVTKEKMAVQPGDWPARVAVGLFAALGWLGAAFLHPGKMEHGIAHSAGFPTALVLVALGWGLLSRARPRVLALVGIGIAAEFLLMFWSHWWFLTRLPEVLEDLPGNAAYKDETIVFLHDRVGDGRYVFVAGLVVVQLVLVALLIDYWRRVRAGAREESS
jgi:hypothetical protein